MLWPRAESWGERRERQGERRAEAEKQAGCYREPW